MTSKTSTEKFEPQWQRLLWAWLPVLVWMGLIFLLSHQPQLIGPDKPIWRLLFMKTAHVGVYAGLYFLWLRAILLAQNIKVTQGQKIPSRVWWWSLLACLIFAISDEWHQAFIPGRTATIKDVGFDLLGAGAMMGVIYLRLV